MKLAHLAIVATLLVGAASAVQAADLRLDDAALDRVSAGLSLPGFPGLPSAPGFPAAPRLFSGPGLPSAPGIPSSLGLPNSPLLQQLPSILTANGYGDVLGVLGMIGLFGQGGGMAGLPIVGN